jgi:hypothetical protein
VRLIAWPHWIHKEKLTEPIGLLHWYSTWMMIDLGSIELLAWPCELSMRVLSSPIHLIAQFGESRGRKQALDRYSTASDHHEL